MNSVNSAKTVNLINHWVLNWSQFKDPVCYLFLSGAVVASWYLTHKVVGSNNSLTSVIQWIQWKHLWKTQLCHHYCYLNDFCRNRECFLIICLLFMLSGRFCWQYLEQFGKWNNLLLWSHPVYTLRSVSVDVYTTRNISETKMSVQRKWKNLQE